MMFGYLDLTPRWRNRSIITHATAGACPLIHPVPGVPVWKITNAVAGSVAGDIFTPTPGWYGLCHIIGKCQNVRALCSVWVVPDQNPLDCQNRQHWRITTSIKRMLAGSWVRPRPGAEDFFTEAGKYYHDYSLGGWLGGSFQYMDPIVRAGNTLDGAITTVTLGTPHRWFVLERVSGANNVWLDRTSSCTPTGSVTGTAVHFTLPTAATTDWTLMAINRWDCWIIGDT